MLPRTLTVTELTQSIKALLEVNFSDVYLQGEISNLARPSSGHLYFNIKDEESQIAGVMFRSAALRNKFDLENGLEVILFGRITVYEPRGNYQLIVENVEPVGAGALHLAFEQLKNKLAREGLFNEEIKKPLPFLPKGVGIVTSPTGAAIRDILQILKRRFPSIPVVLNPVPVQGDGSAKEIAKAISQLDKIPEVDVMIVGRGGGSTEDLWAFNEEVVARAIFRTKKPIISAVGHETDFTIADFTADLRAPTPSAAAELVVPAKQNLLIRIEELNTRLTSAVQNEIEYTSERLEYIRRSLRSPEWVIQNQMIRIDEVTNSLVNQVRHRLGEKRNTTDRHLQQISYLSPLHRIESAKNILDNLLSRLIEKTETSIKNGRNQLMELTHVLNSTSPLSIMNRGYSIVTDSKNNLIASVSQLKEKSRFWIRMADGRVKGETIKISPNQSDDQSSD